MLGRTRVVLTWLLLCEACGGGAASMPQQAPSPPGDWSCLDGSETAHARVTPVASVHPASQPFGVSLQDAYTRGPVGGLDLAVCARTDEDCTAPVSRGLADDGGAATLGAPGGASAFDGFVRVSGSGIATHYLFLANRVASCASCALVIPLYTPSALQATEQMTGLTLGSHEGMVRVDVQDCASAPAAGVSVSIGSFRCGDAGAADATGVQGVYFRPGACGKPVVAYSTGGEGSVSRTALASDATGVALGFGVPEGPIGVAELRDGKTVGGSVAFARAGAVSVVSVRPPTAAGD